MPVNRYDQPIGQRYVSTYVPLPLEEIGQMAKQYSQAHLAGKEAPHALDQLDQAIKAAPVDVDNKKFLMDEYHSKMNDIVNNAKPEDYAKPEYHQKINNLIYQFKNDPRLNAILNNKEVFDKVYTPYLNSKDAKKDLVLTNILDDKHPTKYSQLKPGESLKPLDYITHEDAIKGAKTIMDDVKIDGKSLSSIGQWNKDNNYFLDTNGHQKEITSNKILALARQNVGNYAENTEGRFKFKSLLNDIKGDPHMSYSQFKNDPNIPKEAKDYIDQKLTEDLYNYGAKQIFKDVDLNYSLHDNALSQHAGKKTIDEGTPGLLQTIEGAPISMVSPEFKGLIADGIINDKGEIDWKNLTNSYNVKTSSKESGDRISKMGGWLNLDMGSKGGKDLSNAERLVNIVTQAAKVLGIPKEQIKADNYNKILSDYNQFVTTKGYMGNQYEGTDQEILNNQVVSHPNNYEFLDNDLQVSNKAQDIKAKIFDNKTYRFDVNNRLNVDGKSYLQATITDKESGETETVMIRPKTKEFNQHFDNVAKVADDMKKYYTGEFKSHKAEDPTFKDSNVISQTSTDNGKSIIVVYKNPNDPNDREAIVKYNVSYEPSDVKGEYNTRLSNRQILGNSFKEYQQGEHYNYGMFTAEGHKMYENAASDKIKYEQNTTK